MSRGTSVPRGLRLYYQRDIALVSFIHQSDIAMTYWLPCMAGGMSLVCQSIPIQAVRLRELVVIFSLPVSDCHCVGIQNSYSLYWIRRLPCAVVRTLCASSHTFDFRPNGLPTQDNLSVRGVVFWDLSVLVRRWCNRPFPSEGVSNLASRVLGVDVPHLRGTLLTKGICCLSFQNVFKSWCIPWFPPKICVVLNDKEFCLTAYLLKRYLTISVQSHVNCRNSYFVFKYSRARAVGRHP